MVRNDLEESEFVYGVRLYKIFRLCGLFKMKGHRQEHKEIDIALGELWKAGNEVNSTGMFSFKRAANSQSHEVFLV